MDSKFAWAVAPIVLLLSATACSSGVKEKEQEKPITATIKVHNGGVTVTAGDKELTAEELKTALPDKSTVTTAPDSLVELTWSDGSVTRLGSESVMQVSTGKSRGTLTSGSSWHVVSKQGSKDYRFALNSGGDVVSSGTTFAVDCDPKTPTCNVFLLDGSLKAADSELTPLTWTSVTSAKSDAVKPLTWTELASSDFAQENSALDVSADNSGKATSLEERYKDANPNLASLDGTFLGTRTITGYSCLKGKCDFSSFFPKGHTAERSYTFTIECGDRLPCVGKAKTDYVVGKAKKSKLTVLKFDGTQYTWLLEQDLDACRWTDGRTEGKLANTITWTAKPSKAALKNGNFVVTEITGTIVADNIVTKPVSSATCKPFENSTREKSTMKAAKK